MYLKLAFRNAKRSAGDYLLYITTLVVLSALMMFSNLLAVVSGQNGLQSSSVPMMISIVMVALLYYISGYMLRRRAREFASYILLGMKKNLIALVFFLESLLLGAIGLILGILLGSLLFGAALSILKAWFPVSEAGLWSFGLAARDSFLYFIGIQIISLIGCLRKISTMQIVNLMSENRKNQTLQSTPRPIFWTALCSICLVSDMVLVLLISSGGVTIIMMAANIIIFPLVLGIWAFYKAAFHLLAWIRLYRKSSLYQGNRLYLAAQFLSKITSNIMLNTTLSVCLLFSFLTFSAGFIVPNIPDEMFGGGMGLWLSFAEICLCVVFICIYFSILSVRHIIEMKENRHAFKTMAFLGKTDRQRKSVVKKEIAIKYVFPAVMCLFIILLCAAPLNAFFDSFLAINNLLLISIRIFASCFLVMYAGYAFVVYRMSLKHLGLSELSG